MKKLLIILMVVAMASFLFVGCLGTTPPIEPDEPVEPVVPVSIAPVIEIIGDISLYSTATQYVNGGVLVEGYAPKYSLVKIYIDGVVAGTGTAYGGDEGFTVFITETKLGLDGVKTLYATATEVGLAESVPSTTYKFTLDTVAPEIVSVTAEAEGFVAGDSATLIVTCSEAIDEDTLVLDPVTNVNIWDISAPPLDSSDSIDLDPESIQYDLVSSKVIELSGEWDGFPTETLGTLIRVSYEASEAPTGGDNPDTYVPITDLAGNNLLESVHYCFLEVED